MHTQGLQFRLEGRNHGAYSKSPRTDNEDGVGANKSSLTVVAKSFSTHLDRTSFPFIRRAQPVSRTALSWGTSVSLTQEYRLQIFLLPDLACIASLDLVGGSPFDQCTFVA